jgi:hypothetical protein
MMRALSAAPPNTGGAPLRTSHTDRHARLQPEASIFRMPATNRFPCQLRITFRAPPVERGNVREPCGYDIFCGRMILDAFRSAVSGVVELLVDPSPCFVLGVPFLSAGSLGIVGLLRRGFWRWSGAAPAQVVRRRGRTIGETEFLIRAATSARQRNRRHRTDLSH